MNRFVILHPFFGEEIIVNFDHIIQVFTNERYSKKEAIYSIEWHMKDEINFSEESNDGLSNKKFYFIEERFDGEESRDKRFEEMKQLLAG